MLDNRQDTGMIAEAAVAVLAFLLVVVPPLWYFAPNVESNEGGDDSEA